VPGLKPRAVIEKGNRCGETIESGQPKFEGGSFHGLALHLGPRLLGDLAKAGQVAVNPCRASQMDRAAEGRQVALHVAGDFQLPTESDHVAHHDRTLFDGGLPAEDGQVTRQRFPCAQGVRATEHDLTVAVAALRRDRRNGHGRQQEHGQKYFPNFHLITSLQTENEACPYARRIAERRTRVSE